MPMFRGLTSRFDEWTALVASAIGGTLVLGFVSAILWLS
jgi:hypothetical protein